ncbi:MAG TPA: STAS domain-containing protein [Acidimicrobiales bacterium]|nr:STAS domain-containing protein [Acidimicrobiales bacterium]
MTDGDDFRCEVEHDPPVVRAFGAIDIDSCDVFAAAAEQLMGACGDRPVVFDLSEVTFMDSSGLAVLVKTNVAGHPVIVRNASTTVRRIIDVTGLSGVLVVEP